MYIPDYFSAGTQVAIISYFCCFIDAICRTNGNSRVDTAVLSDPCFVIDNNRSSMGNGKG